MKSKSVISCTEREIIKLINDNFPALKYDSIVAMEELSNQVWCTSVSNELDDSEEFNELLDEKNINSFTNCQWHTNVILDKLCSMDLLEEGDYEIDCTW